MDGAQFPLPVISVYGMDTWQLWSITSCTFVFQICWTMSQNPSYLSLLNWRCSEGFAFHNIVYHYSVHYQSVQISVNLTMHIGFKFTHVPWVYIQHIDHPALLQPLNMQLLDSLVHIWKNEWAIIILIKALQRAYCSVKDGWPYCSKFCKAD